jgi:penicillin V acylase-like amidase (Ntn superfamily)
MFRRYAYSLLFVALALVVPFSVSVAKQDKVVQEDRIIAGGPDKSLEVRHLVLRGSNEQIGKALAQIAIERYGVTLEPANDPERVRAMRMFLARNYPILLDRMRGVAAAFGKSVDDDRYDFAGLGFTELKAGCSIIHVPPALAANGRSVVSRDYDFTTGDLAYRFLKPGMLHPTARPYLMELHPDQGYASMAMYAYDFLSGVIDGINSEGLVVTMALDNEIFGKQTEPTGGPAVGLGELQTMRMLLDTCANVDEAKEALMSTKQYYQYVPVHYLVADRHGNAFVWEYSQVHNKEFVVENPGKLLVMTNFTLHAHLENGLPPSPENARPVCKRYAYLTDHLAGGKLDDKTIREFHQACDAQASQDVDPSQPPERTFWNAVYYPEDRRVRVSYYLGEEPYPGQPRLVKTIRSDYVEFKIEPTNKKPGTMKTAAVAAAAPAVAATSSPNSATSDVKKTIEAAGGEVDVDGARITGVGLDKATNMAAVIPLLPKLQDMETLNMSNAAVTDADVHALAGLPKLKSLGLMNAQIGDDALAVVGTLTALTQLNIIGTRVTDAGLAQISGLKNLEYLGLKGTAIGDAGLANIKGLTNLTTLNVADTKVTDAGLANLAGMTRLEGLNLSNCNISDAGLAQLSGLTTLAGLNLTGTKVTDAGLIHLKTMPRMTKLNVTGTAITDQGVADAKKFLPAWVAVTK